MRRSFARSLDSALAGLDGGLVSEAVPNPQSTAPGQDPTKSDPKLQQQQKDAQQGGEKQAAIANTGKGGEQQAAKGTQAQAQKVEADRQKQQQAGSQLGLQMADSDKQIAMLQAKIQGGAAKPADISKLNQLLTAKKATQDKFMRNYGVNPSA